MGKALQKGAWGAGGMLTAILQGALDRAIQGQQVVQTRGTEVGGIDIQFLFLPTRNV